MIIKNGVLEKIHEDDIKNGKVVVPQGVESIAKNCFKGYKSLEWVDLPSSLKVIGESAFNDSGLKEISIPDSVIEIQDAGFVKCENLKEVKFSNNLKSIGMMAFSRCNNLRDIELPESLQFIGSSAFSLDHGLTKINIPKNVKKLYDNIFLNCYNIEEIELCDSLLDVGNGYFAKDKYLNRRGDKYILSSKQMDGGENLLFDSFNKTKLLPLVLKYPKKAKLFFKDAAFSENYLYLMQNFGDIKEILEKDKKEMAYLRQVLKIAESRDIYTTDESKKDFIKFYYNIGGFLPPVTETRVSKSGNSITTTVDYAQKVGEFLKQEFASDELKMSNLHSIFDSMKPNGVKLEFTKFILDKNNFELLLKEERRQTGFISRCYNEFEKVQATNTANRGSQRQLVPTVEKFVEYFKVNKFSGVDEKTENIAKTISPYFSDQAAFDRAVQINNEREANHISNNITSNPIRENDVFETIDKMQEDIKISELDSLDMLKELADKNYTYEFIEKNDPINFVLGKLCSCCAHLEGAGYGIMHASIVSPDVQNLVIKDKKGEIIAKSTLYINREHGYGVFNNVEVNTNITEDEKNSIYKKYKQAVKRFVDEYNADNPDKKIRKINVGMNLNDLYNQITQNDKEANKLLEAIDYATSYGINGAGHNGDSSDLQYTLYNAEDENGKSV